MTGFARHETIGANGAKIVCEIRSVNGKSLDMRLRVPQGMERLEPQLRQLIHGAITRGNLQLAVTLEGSEARESLQINHAMVDDILAVAGSLHSRYGLAMPTVGELLSIRGVVESSGLTGSEDNDQPVLETVQAALSALKVFRANEGEALKALMLQHLSAIEALTNRVEADPSRSPERIRERLAAQMQVLMESAQGFDEQRLAAEAAILATKADVREELDRLAAHVRAARQLLSGDGPVGRKLDFLAQEFNREANTLCSKSNAASVTTIGLELKAVVDQFREQVQNLE
ncbi:MAG: YicC family protein [Novosphingobium sp.]|nr:YicC family protein [Novosphingobium sp.]